MKLRDLLNACKPPGSTNGKDLLAALDLDVVVLHCGRESSVADAKVMGKVEAVVQEGGRICITESMSAIETYELCLFLEGYDRAQ